MKIKIFPVITVFIFIILALAALASAGASTSIVKKATKDRKYGGYILSYSIPIIALISIVMQYEILYLVGRSDALAAADAAHAVADSAATAATAATAAVAAAAAGK